MYLVHTVLPFRYTGPGVASNMAVVQVKMVSGWVADETSLKPLIYDDRVQLQRYDIEKNKDVQLYFDKVTVIILESCVITFEALHDEFFI